MSVPTFESPCSSPSAPCANLSRSNSPRRRRKVDATIEYYRLVPSQYRNVPDGQNGAVDLLTAQPSRIYATAVDVGTYRSSVVHSRPRTTASVAESSSSSNGRQSNLSVHNNNPNSNPTPATSVDTSPLNQNKPLPPTPNSGDSDYFGDASDGSTSSDEFLCEGELSNGRLGDFAKGSRKHVDLECVVRVESFKKRRRPTEHVQNICSLESRSIASSTRTLRHRRGQLKRGDYVSGSACSSAATSSSSSSSTPHQTEDIIQTEGSETSEFSFEVIGDEGDSYSGGQGPEALFYYSLETSIHNPELENDLHKPTATPFPIHHLRTSARSNHLRRHLIGVSQAYISCEQSLELSASDDPQDAEIYCPFTSGELRQTSRLPDFFPRIRSRLREPRTFGLQLLDVDGSHLAGGPVPHMINPEDPSLPKFGSDWITTTIISENTKINTVVYACYSRRDGHSCFVKRIAVEQHLGKKNGRTLLNEVKIFALMQIVEKRPFLVEPCIRTNVWAWRDAESIFLITDADCGTLDQFSGKLSETELRLVIAEMVIGLQALHSMGIIHSDLCPQNIGMNRDGHIRIGGFHASRFFRPGDCLTRAQNEETFLSNIAYSAPELWTYNALGLAHFDQLIDYWSLGVTVFKLATGESLFGEAPVICVPEIIQQIRRGPTYSWHRIAGSEDFRDFLTQLLEMRPQCRIKGKTIRSHRYFATLASKWKAISEMRHPAPLGCFKQRPKGALSEPQSTHRCTVMSGWKKSCNLIQLLQEQNLEVVERSLETWM